MTGRHRDTRRLGPMLLSGLVGLAGNLVFFLSVSAFRGRFIPVFLNGWLVWVVFACCLGFSLAEIPMMVFALRTLARRTPEPSQEALVLTNVFYIFFAAVYAGIYVVLTGDAVAGAGLSALGIVRFFSSLFFVRLHPERI